MTYTLRHPDVEAVYVKNIRDGENVPKWFIQYMLAGKVQVDAPGHYIVNGFKTDSDSVIIKRHDGSLAVMDETKFWQLYQQLPETRNDPNHD